MFLDTCFCVDIIRETKRKDTGPAVAKLKTIAPSKLFISVFTLCELRAGAEMSKRPKEELRNVGNLLEYITVIFPDISFPVLYGETEAFLRKNGKSVPVMDILIGLCAKSNGMPIITNDVRHFGLIPGLVVESY